MPPGASGSTEQPRCSFGEYLLKEMRKANLCDAIPLSPCTDSASSYPATPCDQDSPALALESEPETAPATPVKEKNPNQIKIKVDWRQKALKFELDVDITVDTPQTLKEKVVFD